MREPTKQELARHEAAHFVVAWAVACPAYRVDITPTARKIDADDPNSKQLGVTNGQCGDYSPFAEILTCIAGPVADLWESDGGQLLKSDEENVARVLSLVAANMPPRSVSTDWYNCVLEMRRFGIDILDPNNFNEAISIFDDAVRCILKLCETPWREAAEHLVEHGRIGFYGPHHPRPSEVPPLPAAFKDRPQPDQGEEAETFFCRWGNDYGEPPEEVQSCVEKFRAMALAQVRRRT